MTVLIVYPPLCLPTALPSAPAYLKTYLSSRLDTSVSSFDANAWLFSHAFPQLRSRARGDGASCSSSFMQELLSSYDALFSQVETGTDLPFLDELYRKILSKRPKIVAFSLSFSSQVPYVKALSFHLEKEGVLVVAGGPVSSELAGEPITILADERALLSFLEQQGYSVHADASFVVADYTDYDRDLYLSPSTVISVRTANTCYYKQCKFCAQYATVPYREQDLFVVAKTIEQSGARHVLVVDELLSLKRLLAVAEMMRSLGVTWWCQLRPTKDLVSHFSHLKSCGLHAISFGVESLSQPVLNAMKKGTRADDISFVIKAAHDAGIVTCVYLIAGYPTECDEDRKKNIDFLLQHKDCLDLVSASPFELHVGSPLSKNSAVFLPSLSSVEIKRVCLQWESYSKLPTELNHIREWLLFVQKQMLSYSS